MKKTEKKRRKELLKNSYGVSGSEYFTDNEWGELLGVNHSEVADIMRTVAERHLKENKNLDKKTD